MDLEWTADANLDENTDLPLQTLGIERGSTLSCTRRIAEHEQLVGVI